MKKISVIIPTYNSQKTLKKCINSILNQSYKNIEIIVIDDGSTDQTAEIIFNNYSYFENLKFIKQSNSGVSSARNKGIEYAKGDYLFFIDSDDTIDSGLLEKLINNVKNNILIGSNYCICNKNKKNLVIYEKEKYSKNEMIEEILTGNILGVVWGYLFDRTTIKKIKFDTNTSYLEDTLFLIEYLKESNIETISYIREGYYYNYFISESSLTATPKNVFSKCRDFVYSLDQINYITKRKYNELIEYKKIILLEKELRLINNKTEYLKIMDAIKINPKYNKDIKLKVFSYFYYKENATLMKIYYLLRNNMKKIKNWRDTTN